MLGVSALSIYLIFLSMGGRHALVLSGDKGQRTVLKSILRQLGVVAHVAGDEDEGLQITKDITLDCIMIDTKVAASIALVGNIVANMRAIISPSIPIFALSDSNDYDSLMAAGFSEVILKPIERNSVRDLLTRQCSLVSGTESFEAKVPIEGSTSDPRESGALRVLVVEDHWANRRLLEAMLMKLGHIMEVCIVDVPTSA